MSAHNSVWILDDDRSIRWVLEKSLSKTGMNTVSFENGDDLLRRLEQESPDAIISDIRMPGISGLDLLSTIQESHPELPVIIMTAYSDLDSTVSSYNRGAFEYLPKPFDIEEAVAMTKRALDHARSRDTDTNKEVVEKDQQIIGEAPSMQEVFRAIGRLSNSNISVLITGESGTGKELVAHALHRHSPRKEKPFVPLNVAAIPKQLIESELFGHEKGAFTGATQQRTGRFEQSNGGTLFLDEIGDMPPDTQTRLLRVLSDSEFYRVGGQSSIKVDVRIIAATHQNLEKLVEEHTFREDLFHRLNVIRIHIPKLCDRREDIPRLTSHFLKAAAEELEVAPKVLRPETEKFLTGLNWPGNVRQLENFCRWVTVMASSREVYLTDLPPEFSHQEMDTSNTGIWTQALRTWADQQLSLGNTSILDEATPVFERTLIDIALKHTSGRRKEAANLLGWGRNTLTRKIKEQGIIHSKSSATNLND
ncbi:MAG: nitrogen regulation protein NR(I) [Gammaproteobacteria bacterium]|jgi:two-component system nitrogen regulation response regulator GlnG|nr:nitrogen regulation protein NR(I) [Gammaproteobacteria bacterium]MCH2577714.1 nitrogen regulation protein NR(I) [Pseudomonadales bacterium]MEC8949949.1 nitrogen regulation protein NR(I) [Pseudomonadota bacterium]MEE3143771.1 nitrogen regulation protein NR(I) [Pseudomonadota bacterium]HAI16299.1 nitrogen regulation protein NR(I) [Gammaproteobacteria bacterium]|tara:strand:- start:13542 stop:14975 length:1434 start_codon:yes stop_codon:yes gene_type:complete